MRRLTALLAGFIAAVALAQVPRAPAQMIVIAGGGGGGQEGGGDTTPIIRIDHQSTAVGGTTYAAVYGTDLGSSANLSRFDGSQGACGASDTWNFTHVGDGSGPNGRNYMRYTRCANVDADPQAGFYGSATTMAPAGGWQDDQPLYFRWRMRMNDPITEDVGHGGIKWIIFGGPGLPDGSSRMILFFYAGAYIGDQIGGGAASATDASHTGISISAGVSGSHAYGLVPNDQWVDVQVAVRWGAEGVGYQRLYVDNDNIAAPDYENLEFNDLTSQTWTFPDLGAGAVGELHWAEQVTTNSETNTDMIGDFLDFEIDDEFDANWNL